MLTEDQLKEGKHNVQMATNATEQGARHNRNGGNGGRLARTMFERFVAKIEVAEIYSPPRVTAMVRQMGIKAGWVDDQGSV